MAWGGTGVELSGTCLGQVPRRDRESHRVLLHRPKATGHWHAHVRAGLDGLAPIPLSNYLSLLQKTSGNCQIINLGCGFDTLYFRLRDTAHQVKNFIELDFPTVTARKCYTIKRNKALLAKIHDEDGEVRLSPTDLHGPSYHLMGVDLRNLDEVDNKLQQAEVDFSLPTIFLAECVLVYIEAQNCRNLLKWIAQKFQAAVFVNYEQV